MKNSFTLPDLEAFDPHAPMRGIERRFLCPLCGENKPKDAAHRSLCLNTQSGLWNCKRCSAAGCLREFWKATKQDVVLNPRERSQRLLKKAFAIDSSSIKLDQVKPSPVETINPTEATASWLSLWQKSVPLEGTPGAVYLQRRGIPWELGEKAGVRFIGSWHGRAALVFPLLNCEGEVVALSGRCLQNGGMDKPGAGPKRFGAFWAVSDGFTALDKRLPAIVLCEAPLDALSLATAGFPALALCGTAPPLWLRQACAFRHVLVAFDADEAGDAAAEKIAVLLRPFGAQVERLRPTKGKDWNDVLIAMGVSALADWLASRLLSDGGLSDHKLAVISNPQPKRD